MNTSIFKIKRFMLLLGCLLLYGCASMQPQLHANKSLLSADEYLQLASTSQNTTKQMYLLKAVERLVQDRSANAAQQILNEVPSQSLPNNLAFEKQLLQADIFILQNQFDRSLPILQNLSAQQNQLNTEDKIDLAQSLAFTYQKTGNIIGSIQERTLIYSLSANQDKLPVLQTILQSLQQLDNNTLTQLFNQNNAPYLRGWLSLAMIMSNNSSENSTQLAQQINQWRSNYSGHLANQLLPKDIQPVSAGSGPKNIALLLPMHGPLASAGAAIRNGFFAAYYNSKQNNKNAPNIFVLDTTRGNISQVYNQAIAQGADFVVGPLAKSDVTELINSTQIRVPTLALNTVSDSKASSIKNLFQFGLSPLDEAQQATAKAWNNHYASAIIIAPNNDWGKNVADYFKQNWQSLGGRVVDQLFYTAQTQALTSDIRHLLNVDSSENQSSQLQRALGEKVRSIPRRRKDVDVIFLVADPNVARQIKPILRYYYAGNIPVFSISQVYDGNPNPSRDRDLNGIIFCDMPWVLSGGMPSNLNSLRQNIQSVWSKSFAQNPKLYALGVDAYDVIPNLNQLAMLPQFGMKGATGTLYLKNQHLYRKLQWSQIKNGQPQIIQ